MPGTTKFLEIEILLEQPGLCLETLGGDYVVVGNRVAQLEYGGCGKRGGRDSEGGKNCEDGFFHCRVYMMDARRHGLWGDGQKFIAQYSPMLGRDEVLRSPPSIRTGATSTDRLGDMSKWASCASTYASTIATR